MNPPTSMVHIRVDDDTNEQATEALASMGLLMSDAVRLFLRRVVIDQAFPLVGLKGSGQVSEFRQPCPIIKVVCNIAQTACRGQSGIKGPGSARSTSTKI